MVEILQHQKFEVKDVVKNIRRFRQWKNRLPLMPIRTRSIKINPKKTPSTSKGTKLCYYLSIRDIIQNILNNPLLYDKLYFGPGIEAEEKKEYWHGDLWAESPLFGQEKITINRGIFDLLDLLLLLMLLTLLFILYIFVLRNLLSK